MYYSFSNLSFNLNQQFLFYLFFAPDCYQKNFPLSRECSLYQTLTFSGLLLSAFLRFFSFSDIIYFTSFLLRTIFNFVFSYDFGENLSQLFIVIDDVHFVERVNLCFRATIFSHAFSLIS